MVRTRRENRAQIERERERTRRLAIAHTRVYGPASEQQRASQRGGINGNQWGANHHERPHTAHGLWTMDYGLWTIDCGLWTTKTIPMYRVLRINGESEQGGTRRGTQEEQRAS